MTSLSSGRPPSMRHSSSTTCSSPSLTKRETEALRLVMEGLTDREVGSALGLSERTVRYHLGNVYNKLGVSARAEAVAKAMELGLVRPRSEDTRLTQ